MIGIVSSSGGRLKVQHKAILPDDTKEFFMSSVIYSYGTAYLDMFGTWHLGSRHKTYESALKSAKKQNTYPVWADKPVQIVQIKVGF